jgi:hypothetical protein
MKIRSIVTSNQEENFVFVEAHLTYELSIEIIKKKEGEYEVVFYTKNTKFIIEIDEFVEFLRNSCKEIA